MGLTGGMTRRGFLSGASAREESEESPALPEGQSVAAIGADCLARAGIHCQSCGDACPEAAIRFRPRTGGPPLPALAPDRCTACGDCVAVCPAGAVSLVAREAADD